jgi:hypothetical protein
VEVKVKKCCHFERHYISTWGSGDTASRILNFGTR